MENFKIISYYNPSVRITTWFLIPLVLYVLISYMSGGDLQFKMDYEQKIFEKLCGFLKCFAFCLFSVFAEGKPPMKYFFILQSVGNVGPGLDYGNF